MTPAQTKRDLPRVPVKIPNGQVVQAKTTGRLNPLATVTVAYGDTDAQSLHDFRADGRPWVDLHFTWEQVAEAATTGKPLSFA